MINITVSHVHVQHCINIARNSVIITYSTYRIVYEIAFLIYFSLKVKNKSFIRM